MDSQQEDRYHETSQLILDTSLNSVYDNRLRVRGRRNGTYNCTIGDNFRHFIPEASIIQVSCSKRIAGIHISLHEASLWHLCLVAREPANLTAVISESNSTHVNTISMCLGSHQVIMTQLAR